VIRLRCDCGRTIKVGDDLAGRLVECSKCGARMRAPQAAPLSGPEALVAAMRELNQAGGDEVPTAEIAQEPAQPDDGATGLEALARAVRSAPAKGNGRSAPSAGKVRKPTAASTRPASRNGRKPAAGARKGLTPATIGAVASAAALMIVIIILCILSGGDEPPKPDTAAKPPPQAAAEQPKPKRFTGHQPGEMFRGVPFEEEKAAGQPTTPPALGAPQKP
jgi:hypothetical protein